MSALRTAGMPIERLRVFELDPNHTVRQSRRDAFDALLEDRIFRGALTWQNPGAVDTWAGAHSDALLAGERPHVSGHRFGHRMAVITRYAQRYCAKNDTIGYFGPVAWARLGGGRTGYYGSGAIRRSKASVEVWAVQSVAAAWTSTPALAAWLPVRIDPACTVVDGSVLRPFRRPHDLTANEAAIVAALCDGIERCGALPAGARLSTADTQSSLSLLSAVGVVQVGFRVPISGDPLSSLETQLSALTDARLREQLTDRLTRVRRACEAAQADPLSPRTAMIEAGLALDDAAGRPVRREPPFTVGGRTPLYLDCRRDLDATVDDELLQVLGGPLSILLDSARWLCGQVADTAEEQLLDAYHLLAANRDVVTLSDLYVTAADVLEPGGQSFAEVVADFQLRWAELLTDNASRRVQLSQTSARRWADVLFPAPRRTWAAARLHSPDLMLRRASSGSLSWVLGELHVALNTLESRFFTSQADNSSDLVDAMAADISRGRIVPFYPNSARDVSSRSYPPLSLDPEDHYRYVSFGSDQGHPAGWTSTPATSIVVSERDGELMASCSSDRWQAPVLECFGEHLSAVAVNLFQLRQQAAHLPRVDIGDVTICRETWRIPLARVTEMCDRSRRERVRLWMDDHGVPQHLFARIPGDRKPFYVNLAAPPLVDNLVRAARRVPEPFQSTADIELVEMLPDPADLWIRLPDGSYASELRMVARDPHLGSLASWPLQS